MKNGAISRRCASPNYVEADDLLPRLQSGALGKFDLVLHLGACSSTTERDAGFLIRNNYEFTRDLAAWSLGEKCRASSMRRPPRLTATARRAWRTTTRKLDTLRPLNMYGYSKHLFDLHARRAGISEQNRRAEILQRLRPERGSQGRHALARPQKFRAGANRGRHPAVQELPEGFPRRRAEARFSLRQGRRGDDAASGRDQKGRRPFQHRLRRGADVD